MVKLQTTLLQGLTRQFNSTSSTTVELPEDLTFPLETMADVDHLEARLVDDAVHNLLVIIKYCFYL